MDLRDHGEVKGHRILDGFRALKAVDKKIMVSSLVALGRIGLEHDTIQEIDVNPLVVEDGNPVAVDALVTFR